MAKDIDLNLDRLVKVLALSGSGQDGEALAALRTAQQMLAGSGLSLTDLGLLLAKPSRRADIDISRGLLKAYEARQALLERENGQLRKDILTATTMLERWKQLSENMQRDSQKHQSAAEKWRGLARRTADHLWELGQQLQAIDEPPRDPLDTGGPETDPKATVVRFSVKKR